MTSDLIVEPADLDEATTILIGAPGEVLRLRPDGSAQGATFAGDIVDLDLSDECKVRLRSGYGEFPRIVAALVAEIAYLKALERQP